MTAQELIDKFDIQDTIEIFWIIKLEKYLKEFQFNNKTELYKKINELKDIKKALIQQTKEQADRNLFPFYNIETAEKTEDPEILKKILSKGKDDYISRAAARNINCPPEALKEVLSRGKNDEVSWRAAQNQNCPPEILSEILSMWKNDTISIYAASNPNCPSEALKEVLLRGKNNEVSWCAAENLNCPPEALKEVLSRGENDRVSVYAAQNKNCPPEMLSEILSRGKNNEISCVAAKNPNCPPEALAEVLSRGKNNEISCIAAKNLNCPPESLAEVLSRGKDNDVSWDASDNPNCPKDIKEWWEKNKKLANSNNWYKTSQSSYVQELIDKFDIQNPMEIFWIIKFEEYLKALPFNSKKELDSIINKFKNDKKLLKGIERQTIKALYPFYNLETAEKTKDPEILKKIIDLGRANYLAELAAQNPNCPKEYTEKFANYFIEKNWYCPRFKCDWAREIMSSKNPPENWIEAINRHIEENGDAPNFADKWAENKLNSGDFPKSWIDGINRYIEENRYPPEFASEWAKKILDNGDAPQSWIQAIWRYINDNKYPPYFAEEWYSKPNDERYRKQSENPKQSNNYNNWYKISKYHL